MQGLRTPQNRRQGLKRDTNDIIFGLLGREGTPGCLGVKANHQGLGICCLKSFPHYFSPQTPRCPVLGDLLKKIHVGIEEEGKPGPKCIHIQTNSKRCLDVCNPVRQCEGHLLHSGGTRFPDMIPADADRIPHGDIFSTIGKYVRNNPHRGFGWIYIGAPG